MSECSRFSDGITYSVDENKKICRVSVNTNKNVGKCLESLRIKFGMPIWIFIPLDCEKFPECLEEVLKNDCKYPHISEETPCISQNCHSIAMLSNFPNPNSSNPNSNPNSSNPNYPENLIKIEYALAQYKKESCDMLCKFDDKAIKFLKKTSSMGHSKNKDGTVTQKEMTGSFHISKKKTNNIFIISYDEKYKLGQEEGVSVSGTKYNYHSHPKEAYIKHSVEYGWPSITDFIGYLKLGNKTTFHCVAAIEGIYILSFGPFWVNKIEKVDKDFVKKNYDYDSVNNIDPFEFVEKINAVLYEGHPIYIVKFLPWDMANTIFSVSYKKKNGNCFVDDETENVVKKVKMKIR